MDEHRFDDLVRALGERGSRRAALSLLAGSLGALAAVPWTDALAKGKNKKKKKKKKCKEPCPPGFVRGKRSCLCRCPEGMRECRDHCVPKTGCCPSDPLCPEDPKGCCHSPGVEVCTVDGCCAELNGLKACDGRCVDTTIDTSHCGDCGIACKSGERCVGGKCEQDYCANGQPVCGDTCCEPGEECCNGICRFVGTAICTADGWCPPVSGHACCGTAGCAEGPCCNTDIEACCVSMDSNGNIDTHCCPGDGDECAPGGCCPPGMRWGNCGLCCPINGIGCEGCVAPGPGRG